VIVSYFEGVQNLQDFYREEEETNERLSALMRRAFQGLWDYAKKHNVSLRTAAFMMGLERVVEAIRLRGVFP